MQSIAALPYLETVRGPSIASLPPKGHADLTHRLRGEIRIRVDVLDIIQVFEIIQQPEYLLCSFSIQLAVGLGHHRNFSGFRFEPAGHQRIFDIEKVIRCRRHFDTTIIVGFNVRPERGVAEAADREGIDLRLHTIIYQLIDEVKQAMVGQLEPTFEESTLGTAEVRDTFRIPRVGTIAGCYITDGKFTRDAKARLVRDSRIIYEGQLRSLRRFKDDVREVQSGYECGIGLENFNDVKIGDVIEAFEVKEIAPSL